MTLTFYDVSNHQGGLKLNTLESDAFIFKATEGVGFVDKWCDNFVEQAKALGKPWGVYHFLDGSDVIKQAEFFYNNCKNYVGKGILVLDYEMYGRQGAVKAKQFLDHLYKLTGVRGWIYMNESDSNNDNWQPLAKDYPLWIAKYSSQKPNHTKGLSVIAWQYTSTPLDKNIYYGDKASWAKYAAGDKGTNNVKVDTKPNKDFYTETGKYTSRVDTHFFKEKELINKSSVNIKKGQVVYADEIHVEVGHDGKKYYRGAWQLGKTKLYFSLNKSTMKK